MIYNLKKITESLLDSVVEAGEIAKEISQRGVKITIKHDKSPVTDGDIEVDQILTSNIKKLTPDIPIISEETVDLRVAELFVVIPESYLTVELTFKYK